MTKEEFNNTDEGLTMIVSVNPETGKCMFDTYDWRIAESWLEDIKKDFPAFMHFMTLNPAAVKQRAKELFNYTIEE